MDDEAKAQIRDSNISQVPQRSGSIECTDQECLATYSHWGHSVDLPVVRADETLRSSE